MTEMSLNQSGAEESSVVKPSLERNLESMEKKICFPFWEFAIFLKLMSWIWSCYFWCLIFFGIVKRERTYDTHTKTWVIVWLKTVRQWKEQPSAEKRKNPKTSELIVDRPNTFFLVTVTQFGFDGWGFKGSSPPQMLGFSVCWQQPRAFPGNCQLAGCLCVVQVYWRALLLRMLSWLSRVISWMAQKAQCAFWLFF